MLYRTADRNLHTYELGQIGELVADELLVPVEPDYEAAEQAVRDEAYRRGLDRFIGGASLVRAAVDAALKEEPIGCFCDADTLAAEGDDHQQLTHGRLKEGT